MSAPASGVTTRLFASLQAVGCEVTAVELADILWLARYVPASRRAEPGSTSPPTPPPLTPPQLPEGDATRKPPSEMPSSAPLERDSHAAEGLYAREHDARLTRGRRASIIRAPGAPALPNALALSRALRPLLKKRVSRHRWQLDEEATAEATALNHGLATPMFRPSAERWFEVAFVVDGAPSMHVWHQAAGELRRLLMRHGGFRDLRQYRLRPADARVGAGAGAGVGDEVELISESGRRLTPNAISDPSGRRLIVLLSDAVSEMWRELPLRRALFAWSRWSPVVLVDVLPRRMWPHTAIGFAERTMAPRRAAAPNVEWAVERDWWDAAEGRRNITLPVITLDADQFGRWARALMQVSAEHCAGTLLPLEAVPGPLDAPAVSEPMTALERVQQFRSAASEPAYQLACYFAATLPVLPVLRIVQRQMMPETGPGHLAEFLLSGLVRPRTTGSGAEGRRASADVGRASVDGAAAEQATEKFPQKPAEYDSAGRVDPERVVYEFYPGVQELLLAQLDATEVPRIMPAIEAYLKAHLGESYELSALIPDDRGAEKISDEALPFVKPAFELMQRILGRRPRAATTVGLYDRLVRILRRAFPDRDIFPYVEDVRVLSDDEARSRLISVAVELMPDEQREALVPLAVTLPSPDLPQRLWRRLFDRTALAPLDLMEGVTWADGNGLVVTADVREGLRHHVARARLPELHRRIVESYLGLPGELAWALPSSADVYFYRHILTHVAGAQDDDLARALVGSPDWIEDKFRACGFADLLADLERFSHVPAIRELHEIAARRGGKDQESTQGWAESLIEEWSSTLSDAEANAPVETPTEAAAEMSPPSTEAHAAGTATAATNAPVADAPPKVWVLVAGTGTGTLTEFERDVTIALGTRLAQDGHGLICGDWYGLDTLIEESYAKEVARLGRRLGDKLIRLASTDRVAKFLPGPADVVSYASDREFFERALERADVVVLIGGKGFTLEVGHVAHSRFVPVIPIPVAGGDAARLFAELVREEIYRPDDPLNTPRGSDGSLQRIVDRIAELVRDAEPSRHVLSLGEEYMRTYDRTRGERIEARLLTLLRRGVRADLDLAISQAAKNLSVTKCLGAFVYRAKPDPAHTPSLFEPDDSPHVVLQRVRACEVAFETQAARHSLPSDAEQQLSRLYSTLEENHDDITRQAKQFMAGRLLPLARLVTMAEQAASPRFDDLQTLGLTAGAMVHQDMALDCLTDPHPGWRLVGLAAFTRPPLQVPPLPEGMTSRILQATRFEATFRSHLQLAVEALDQMMQTSPPVNLDESERATLEWMREQVRSDSRAAGPVPPTSPEREKQDAVELAVLVERYHAIRLEPSGDERTEHMEAVVEQMRDVVTDAEGFDVGARLDDGDRGWRLAAYAFVRERPDGAMYVPLCRSLLKYRALLGPVQPASLDNRPFGEYQGLLALDRVDETLSTYSDDQHMAWDAVQRAIRVDPATDRGGVLSRISRRRKNLGRYDPESVGHFLRQAGQFHDALAAHLERLSTAERRAAEDSGNKGLQRKLAWAHDNVGETLQLMRNAAESLVHHRAALDIRRQLVATEPANLPWLQDLHVTLGRIGDAEWTLGNLSEAAAAYQETVDIMRQLIAAVSPQALWWRALQSSLNKLGLVRYRQGLFAAALANYREALDIDRQLSSSDSPDPFWQRTKATTWNNIGDVLTVQGDLVGALAAYGESLAIDERLSALDPSNAEAQRDVAAAREQVARLRGLQSSGNDERR